MIEPRRGFTEYDYEGELVKWPNCEITSCPNGVCLGMSLSLCYPHGIEFGAFTVEEFEADRKARLVGEQNARPTEE